MENSRALTFPGSALLGTLVGVGTNVMVPVILDPKHTTLQGIARSTINNPKGLGVQATIFLTYQAGINKISADRENPTIKERLVAGSAAAAVATPLATLAESSLVFSGTHVQRPSLLKAMGPTAVVELISLTALFGGAEALNRSLHPQVSNPRLRSLLSYGGAGFVAGILLDPVNRYKQNVFIDDFKRVGYPIKKLSVEKFFTKNALSSGRVVAIVTICAGMLKDAIPAYLSSTGH